MRITTVQNLDSAGLSITFFMGRTGSERNEVIERVITSSIGILYSELHIHWQ